MYRFHVWGLSGSLAIEHERDLEEAVICLHRHLDAMTDVASRFIDDSEVCRVNAASGPVRVSSDFARVYDAARRAYELTNGLYDPTVAPSLSALGYDRSYDTLTDDPGPSAPTTPAPGLSDVAFDRATMTLARPFGVTFDFGGVAKALCADLVADELSARGGVCVEIGGDVATRGTGPDGPWIIGVSDTLHVGAAGPRVAFGDGGIATSSRLVRTWRRGGRLEHHVIDPRTGQAAQGPIATATVAADSCATANAFATAALVLGEDAGYEIAQAGWSARLVREDGTLEFVGGWPREESLCSH